MSEVPLLTLPPHPSNKGPEEVTPSQEHKEATVTSDDEEVSTQAPDTELHLKVDDELHVKLGDEYPPSHSPSAAPMATPRARLRDRKGNETPRTRALFQKQQQVIVPKNMGMDELKFSNERPPLPRVDSGGFVQYVDEAAQSAMLISAASKNQILQMKELFSLGVSPDSADYDKRSALHIACAEGHEDAVSLLLDQGASINVKDRFGFTPLDEAIKSRNDELVKLLLERGAQLSKASSETSLLNLAMQSNDESVRLAELLLEAKVDPNCSDFDGRTPLHLAVCESNVPMAELLLKHNADPFKEDRWRCTPLMECTRHANRTGMNEMTRLFQTVTQPQEDSAFSTFTVVFSILQGIIIILMFSTTTYGEGAAGGDEALEHADMQMYPYFQDVNVMVFIGFGYLMTFLRKNIFNSIGLTFMVAALVIEWHMLVNGFFAQAFCKYHNGHNVCDTIWHNIHLGLENMLLADFCAASVLIAYGALLGKVTPAQLCVMAFFQVIFFTINEHFGRALQVTDIGGSLVIHMFGAYFGMAFSIATRTKHASTHVNNSSVYHSDAFAMIGTIFLFLFWPSFNGAPSTNDSQRERVAINTFLSLCASCFCAFIASHVARKEHRFCMVDVQNATLAGGVAMGTCADLLITPGAAVSIGSIAGVVSVLGFVFVQPVLERKLGFHDTCGVNNLHGMPSIIGGFSGAIAAGLATEVAYGPIQLAASFPALANGSRTPREQAGAQIAFIFITFGWSLLTGFLTGWFTRACPFLRINEQFLFSDEQDWEVPGLENPYYFDHRGEIERSSPNEFPSLTNRLVALEAKIAALSKPTLRKSSFQIVDTPSSSSTSPKTDEVEKVLMQLLQDVQRRKSA